MNMPDPQAFASAWMESNPLAAMMQDTGAHIKPEAMEQLKNDYLKDFGVLWQDFISGKTPAISDRRFSSAAWQGNPMSAFNAAAYLLNAKFLNAMVETVEANAQQKQKIRFAVQQIIDAMSPANFLATNPEAQQKMIETKGESLSKGLANMLADMNKGHISLSDESAFEVGRNLATTEGTVVYENPLFQLIQYKPQTESVNQTPLLMVPPCINKFYILDLQPENSLVRYAVEQGNTVFLVSWSNPDKSLANTTWDDYVDKGVIQAIRVTQEITGEDKLNMFGFCVGGTIVSTALAVLAARGEQAANSLTLLTTFLDFSDTGVLDVFVDEAQVAIREQQLKAGGLMPAATWRPRSPACVRTTWYGTTCSPTTLKATIQRRLTCCTGTRTAPICRGRCSAGTCAIPTTRTSSRSRAGSASAACPWICAWSTCRPSSMPRARTISCPGTVPTPRRPCCRARSNSCSAPRAISPA